MSRLEDDSTDPWRYVIVLTKFVLLFVDAGLTKSLGVLMHEMVSRFDTDYKTMTFVCSLPATLMHFAAPLVRVLVLVIDRRVLATLGGLLCSVPLMFVPFTNNIFVLGTLMALTGVGMSFQFLPAMIVIYEYFPKSFIAACTLALFGSTAGAFLLPVIVERSLEGYGFAGAFLILGGICLNAVPCGAVLRPRSDCGWIQNAERSSTEHDSRGNCSVTDKSNTERECATLWDKQTSDKYMADDENMSQERTQSEAEATVPEIPPAGSSGSVLIFVREPFFSLTSPAVFLQVYTMYAWMLFLVPHAEWIGIDQSRAVFLSSVAGISGVFGRILYLVLLQRGCSNVSIFCAASFACGCSFFIDSASSTYAFQAIVATVQGFTMFILDSLPHALMKLTVRNKANVDSAIVANSFIIGAAAATGDVLSGHIYDVTASYEIVYLTFGGILILVIFNLVLYAVIERCHPQSKYPDEDGFREK